MEENLMISDLMFNLEKIEELREKCRRKGIRTPLDYGKTVFEIGKYYKSKSDKLHKFVHVLTCITTITHGEILLGEDPSGVFVSLSEYNPEDWVETIASEFDEMWAKNR